MGGEGKGQRGARERQQLQEWRVSPREAGRERDADRQPHDALTVQRDSRPPVDQQCGDRDGRDPQRDVQAGRACSTHQDVADDPKHHAGDEQRRNEGRRHGMHPRRARTRAAADDAVSVPGPRPLLILCIVSVSSPAVRIPERRIVTHTCAPVFVRLLCPARGRSRSGMTLHCKVLCVNITGMRILRATHLGMCFGVRDAIALALQHADAAPLTILGDLVHNPTVLRTLDAQGHRRRAGRRRREDTDRDGDGARHIRPHPVADARARTDRHPGDVPARRRRASHGRCPRPRRLPRRRRRPARPRRSAGAHGRSRLLRRRPRRRRRPRAG